MWIWCSIAMISMLIGLFLFPNQNLDQKEPNLAKNDSLASAVFHRDFKLKKESLKGRFRESLLYLKSPIFWVHLLMFSVGNCTIALGWVLNIRNWPVKCSALIRKSKGGTRHFWLKTFDSIRLNCEIHWRREHGQRSYSIGWWSQFWKYSTKIRMDKNKFSRIIFATYRDTGFKIWMYIIL